MQGFTPSYPFQPHPLLRHRHAQSSYGTLFPRAFEDPAWLAAGQARELVLPDGDRLASIWHRHPDDPERKRPLLVLLHGLEGDLNSHYVRGMSVKAYKLGFHSVRFSYRGCGGTEHLSRRLYNGAMIEDVDHVVRLAIAEGPGPVVLAGVSLGANKLLRLLGTYGDHPPTGLAGGVAISPPIDFFQTRDAFMRGLNKGYDRFFLRKLKRKLRERDRLYGANDPAMLERSRQGLKARWLRDFDAVVTAPEGGYADTLDYYGTANAADSLAAIRVPTLIVHAQDDPIIPMAMFESRRAMIAANPCLTTIFTSEGGHVGFMEHPRAQRPEPWMDAYWAENQALGYVRWLTQGPHSPG